MITLIFVTTLPFVTILLFVIRASPKSLERLRGRPDHEEEGGGVKGWELGPPAVHRRGVDAEDDAADNRGSPSAARTASRSRATFRVEACGSRSARAAQRAASSQLRATLVAKLRRSGPTHAALFAVAYGQPHSSGVLRPWNRGSSIFGKLLLPPSQADHRRVLAVLRYLRST